MASRTTALGPVYAATAVNKMKKWDLNFQEERFFEKLRPDKWLVGGVARNTVLKNDFRGDLFLSAESQDNFKNKAFNDAIRYYEIKGLARTIKRRNDWLTAWQIRNE
ncbi:MAG: hypothetical protein ABII88_02355 [Candidatus Omnitrophota bacterium]